MRTTASIAFGVFPLAQRNRSWLLTGGVQRHDDADVDAARVDLRRDATRDMPRDARLVTSHGKPGSATFFCSLTGAAPVTSDAVRARTLLPVPLPAAPVLRACTLITCA